MDARTAAPDMRTRADRPSWLTAALEQNRDDRYVDMAITRDIVVQWFRPLPRRHSGIKIRGTLRDAPSG